MNNSMKHRIRIATCTALMVTSGLTVLHTAAAEQAASSQREMLSKHETVAQFDGVAYHRCMGMTSLCPDKCGSSGDMATFRILKYIAYAKPGEYGDPEQTTYQFLVQDNMKNAKVSATIKAAVESLKKGDYVRLDWQHDYVTQDGSKFPERTVIALKPITREEADKLTGGLDKLPKAEPANPPTGPRPSFR
jgi:hypothetical protein